MNSDDLGNLPGIFIPCEAIEALKLLLNTLYDKGMLTDERFKLINCPENIQDILNHLL
ncbi:MAG TPA: hypothetical protein VFD03_08005 [Clostridia bacterium]|nr:hypothetical protein [Clostridia bacterium]